MILKPTPIVALLFSTLLTHSLMAAESMPLDVKRDTFCTEVQNILAKTSVPSINEVFDDYAEFRHSKPSPDPLMTYQYVHHSGDMPRMVSCKVKAADHIRAVYGESAAGEQGLCREVTVLIHAQVVAELEAAGDPAVALARTMVIEPDEPFEMGSQYLAEFPLSFQGSDDKLHINTQSLQVNWDDRKFWIMPYRLRGQTCRCWRQQI
jgi:hypothetical protein